MKKINHYDLAEVIDNFGIDKISNCKTLTDWLSSSGNLNKFEKELLSKIQQEILIKWDEWNEEELKMKFVSLVLFLANIDVPKKINTFFERPMVGIVNDIKISVIVDCMIATPKKSGNPDAPYFFLQEFKRTKGDSHDPEGQMLAAMILAQDINKDSKPLYGCWLQGRIWYFTVLNGNEYCVSKLFDASDADDLLQIVFILRKLKDLILNR